jgi:hypothetical protein
MRSKADIVVFDESGQSIALVRVIGDRQSTEERALEVRHLTFRRNPPAVPFFLVIAADFTYLWTRADSERPALKVPTKKLLDNYIGHLNSTLENMGRGPLELTVGSWLIDVTIGLPKAIEHPALRESGFAAAVLDGWVDFADAA